MTKQIVKTRTTARLGWSKEEDALLLQSVQEARKNGAPLKAVFDDVAKQTGRKPNSIRNYYYACIKQEGADVRAAHNPAFVPFTDEEINSLLRTVLEAQARGMSVRACTLEMGKGDNRAMLRYQNKYRSLLKSNPSLVKNTVAAMRIAGEPVVDPYEKQAVSHRVGRPRKKTGSLVDVVGSLVNQLDRVEGLDATSLLEGLSALAVAAARGSETLQQLCAMESYQDTAILLEELSELKAQLSDQNRELVAQRDRFGTLLGYFRQLMDVNRDFLGLTSVTKVSSLSNYIRELSRNVEDCERWMLESR